MALARRVCGAVVRHTDPLGVLVSGSIADGLAGPDSDVDMAVYYDSAPSAEACEAYRRELGAAALRIVVPPGPDGFFESFQLEGSEIQVAASTRAGLKTVFDSILVDFAVTDPEQKAIAGILKGLPLHGAQFVGALQSQLRDYPDGLSRAMVEHYLRVFPAWAFSATWYADRDAHLFRRQVVLDAAFGVLGILAGLNRVYHSNFQLKHVHALADSFAHSPDRLAARLEAVFELSPQEGLLELRSLFGETVELVGRYMPEIDLAAARRSAARPGP